MRIPGGAILALCCYALDPAALRAQVMPPKTPLPTESVHEIGGKTINQWMDDLKHVDASIREQAIRAITQFGPEASKAVPVIVERLTDNDSSPRAKAAMALGMMEIRKEDVSRVVQALGNRLLQDPQSIVRYQAAVTLQRFGADSHGALNGLIRGASDAATWEIRHASVIALRDAGRDARGGPNVNALRALIQALTDPASFQVRFEAVMALGALGVSDDPTLQAMEVKALQERLTDREPTVRIWANIVLMNLDKVTDSSLQQVVKFLKHAELRVRTNAARGLGALADKGKAAIPALVSALEDKEAVVVATAGWALGQMTDLPASARTALLDLFKHPDPQIRAAAAYAIGSAGMRGRYAISTLVQSLENKEQPPLVIGWCCWALGEIGEPTPPVLSALQAMSQRKDVDESLRLMAQGAIEQLRKPKKAN